MCPTNLNTTGGHCVQCWILQCRRNVLGPFPRSVPQNNPVSELYGQLHRQHGLVFALTCTFNCETLQYIDRWVPFQFMSNQFNLSQVDYNQVEKHLKDDQWSLIARCLNTYVNKVFLFFILKKCTNISKNLFSLCHYGVLCVDWWGFVLFNQFQRL